MPSKFEVIIVEDQRELGEVVAKRLFDFIEEHPDGVIALPTGKTPKPFIESLKRSTSIPNTKRIRFIQLDEYFPIAPNDPKSFCFYVREHYLSVLKIAPENALTMEKLYSKTFEEANEFCQEYERKIKEWGGIGFFLGGIGLDGHIAFNLRGSDLNSETRLVNLGTTLAATIGIQTICRRPDVQTVLFADGEAKAQIVKRAIQETPSIEVPATALRFTNKPQFYLTKTAAKYL